MSFYQTNNKILSKSINGVETIDFNKYPDLLDILFNHWICQKENYSRIKKEFNRGEFEMSLAIIEDTFNISRKKARGLMKRFIDEEIIKLKKRGSNSSRKSIYIYLSALEKIDENEGTVKGIARAQQGHSETLKNECVHSNKGHSEGTVKDIVKGNSKKEYKKRINKNIYTEIFDYWINKDIYKHRELTSNMEKAIDKALKKHKNIEVIKEAINNYSEILKSNFYYSHIFTLEKFLTQGNGIPNFIGEGEILINYKKDLEKSRLQDSVEEKTNSEIIDGYEYETV